MNLIFPYPSVLLSMPERTERLRFVLLLFLVFSLPFDMVYSSVLFIGLSFLTLIDLNLAKLKEIPKQAPFFFSVFLLGILAYSYSYHKHEAGFILERQLTILLFPFILPLAITIDKPKINALLSALASSCVLAIFYLFIHMVINIHYKLHLPLLNTMFSGAFFNHQFSEPIDIHAGYFSMYVAFALFYLISLFTRLSSLRSRLFLLAVLFIIFLGLFFLASRNTIITTLIVFLFVFPFYFVTKKLRFSIIVLLFLGFVFIAFKNIPYLRERFSVELLSEIKPLNNGLYMNYSSAEPRYERWEGGMALVKRSPLIGYGTGDEIAMLKTQYIQKGLYISYLEDFNAHNQYLSFLLKNGVLGLAIFLMAFVYYLRLAFLNRDFMYISFLILLLIGFYTENVLDANKGILFFTFFNTLFGYEALKSLKMKGKTK